MEPRSLQEETTERRIASAAPSVRISKQHSRLDRFLWRINWLYCLAFHRFRWDTADPLPPEGPAILVCNHRSSVDPFILAAATHRVLSFLIAHEYCGIPVMRAFFQHIGCVPVRRNQRDVGAIRGSLRALAGGATLCIFPEGGIGRGLEDARLGVGYLSLRSRAPVIPARVSGTPATDSVYRSMVTRSRSRARFGPPLVPPETERRKPSREEIEAFTSTILRAVESLSG